MDTRADVRHICSPAAVRSCAPCHSRSLPTPASELQLSLLLSSGHTSESPCSCASARDQREIDASDSCSRASLPHPHPHAPVAPAKRPACLSPPDLGDRDDTRHTLSLPLSLSRATDADLWSFSLLFHSHIPLLVGKSAQRLHKREREREERATSHAAKKVVSWRAFAAAVLLESGCRAAACLSPSFSLSAAAAVTAVACCACGQARSAQGIVCW